MSSRKIGVKGKPIGSQGREIINNVIRFMHREAENGLEIPLIQYRNRVLAATGISQSTYQRIATEGRKQLHSPSTSFSSPGKRRQRKSPVFDKLTPGFIEDMKTIIYHIYILEKRRPTLRCISQKMKDKQLDFDGKMTSLNKLLKQMGFRWRKTTDKKKVLIEKFDFRAKRIEFLQQSIKYRSENRYMVYTGETNILPSHTVSKGENNKEMKKSILKGQRLNIVYAGGERGFVPNALLISESGSKIGDCRDDTNHMKFLKWVETQLIPNLPERSVLVVDAASHHNATVDRNITSASPKADMGKWLSERGLDFQENWTKPELYKKIQENKRRFPTKFKLDVMMQRHGHSVLRLPPGHPELNPIEKIWAMVKHSVAARNETFRLADVRRLSVDEFERIGVAEWKKMCDHVRHYEELQIDREHLLDRMMDEILFTPNAGGSSSEEDTDSGSESDLDVNLVPTSDAEY